MNEALIMKKSLKYHFHNAVASAFHMGDSMLKNFVLGAAAICLPVYTAGELVLRDASSVRTAETGDVQVQALDKSLSQLVTFTREGKAKMEQLNNLRAQRASDPLNADLEQKLAVMEEQQAGLERTLENGKRGFAYSVIMSEGISEVDAKNLVRRYQESFGDPDLYSVRSSGPGTIGLHAFSYLDECQKEVMSGRVYETADVADKVDSCMYTAADNRSFGATMGGLFGGLPAGIALLVFLSAVGQRSRGIAKDEEHNCRIKQVREEICKPVKTDEFSLKIKVQKPKA